MTSDLRIQGEVVVNSEQAEGALNRVGDKATQMAANMQQAGARAGKAVDQIGEIAKSQGDKFTRAESAIVASIKRVTLEAAKSQQAVEKIGDIQFNIAAKGLDPAKFAGMLNVTRQVAEETRALSAAMNGVGTPALDKMGISAAQTAAALRGVPAQFTDIITSLQGGQAPLTVFLQQGGQLKDMFGGAGAAARALGGYVAGLINPFTGAAAAGAALAYAYNQGSKEADAYNKALITTGNAAGTNAAQLKGYAQEISAVVGTQGKAAESLAALASTGKIGAESLKEAAHAAVQYERATGQALDKTADQFAALRNEPLAAVLKLNDGMNFLTDSTYKQIKSLEEQGKTAEAANVAQRAFADTLSGRAGEMERNLGTVERGWLAVKDAAKSAWDAILNVGRASTNVDQLAAVRKQIADREKQLANGGFGENEGGAAFGRPSQAATERLRAELSALQAQAAALEGVAYASRTAAEEERKRGEQVKATAAFDKAGEKFLTDKARMERELAAARVQGAEAGKSQAEIEQRLAQIRESYAKKGGGSSGIAAENKELRDQMRVFADLAGVSSTYYADLANAQKQRAAGVITEQQYVQVVDALIKKQPFAVAIAKEQAEATKAQAKASEEAARAHLKYVESFGKGAAAAQQQADQLRTEEAAAAIAASGYYSLAQAIELVTIARLEEKRDGLMGNEEAYLAVQKEIDARKELLTLIGSKEARKAAEESAKDAARAWERAAEDINRSLTDALLRGFESGKDFAKNLRDTLKNMFNTLVLRPVISAIVNPVAGSVTNALGLSGAQGGGNSVMGSIQTASNLNSLYGAGSQALFGGAAGASAASLGYANIVGMAGGDAIGALAAANGMWAGVATGAQAAAQAAIASNAAMAAGTAAALPAGTTAAAAGAAGAGGSSATGALASIPGWGWAAAAAAVVLGSVLSRKTEKRGSGLMGTLGEEDGVRDLDLMRKGGSLLSGPKWFVRDMGVSGMDDALQETYKAQRDALMQMGDALGLATAGVENFTVQLGTDTLGDQKVRGIRLDGLSDQEANAKIAEALATANNEIAQQIIGSWEDVATTSMRYIEQSSSDGGGWFNAVPEESTTRSYVNSEFARDGEKAIDTLTRLATSLMGVNSVFENLGYTLYEASLAGGDMASQLVELFGGLEAFGQSTAAYFQNFYSVGEQRAAQQRALQSALDKVDLKLPDIDAGDARAQFRALAEAQDLTTESGRSAYTSLIQLSGAFASITQSAEDAASAAKQLAEEQERAREDAIRGARDLLKRAIDRDRDALQDQASGMQDVINALSASVSMLKSNARELYGQVDGTAQMLAAQGMVYIEQALAGVRSGASVADYAGLSDAIGAARGGISGGAYASQFERDRDTLILAGQLSELADISDAQLSFEDKQLKALNAQLDTLDALAQRADDLINGTTALTGTVQSYFDQLLKLLNPEKPEEAEKKTSGGFAIGGSATGGGGGDSGTPYDKDAAVRYTVGAQLKYGADKGLSHDDPAVLKAINAAVYGTGITQADIAKAYGVPEDDIARLFAGVGLPKFDVGTNRVPRTGLAVVHEGEAIIPKAYNPWAGGQSMGGNAEMVAELRALREEVAQLRAVSQATASSTAQMAEQLDQVTEGGNAMRTEAIA